jgi:hypothetical protein
LRAVPVPPTDEGAGVRPSGTGRQRNNTESGDDFDIPKSPHRVLLIRVIRIFGPSSHRAEHALSYIVPPAGRMKSSKSR